MRPFSLQDDDVDPIFRALEHSPDAVFVTDRRNHIVFWNDAARHLLGFTADEAVGTDCEALLGGCDLFGNRYCSDECPVMRMARRGEVVRNFELTLNTSDRTTLVADISLLQLRAGNGDDFFLVHLVRSVSARPETAAPPRPRLVAARESTDVRARKLTAREVEVLAMLAAGRTTPEIAERLHISQLTARSHIQNILEKIEVHSKAEAVAFAFQKNLI